MPEPILLHPHLRARRTARVEAIHPRLQAVVDESVGMTPAEIDATYRAVWDEQRRAEGLEIVPVMTLGEMP